MNYSYYKFLGYPSISGPYYIIRLVHLELADHTLNLTEEAYEVLIHLLSQALLAEYVRAVH